MNQHPCGKPGGAATAASSPSLKQLAQLAVVGICVGTGVCAGLFLRDKLLFHTNVFDALECSAAATTQNFKRKRGGHDAAKRATRRESARFLRPMGDGRPVHNSSRVQFSAAVRLPCTAFGGFSSALQSGPLL